LGQRAFAQLGQHCFETPLGKPDAQPVGLRLANGRLFQWQGLLLLIQADKDVKFDNVVYVMDLAKQLKVDKLGVAVIPQVLK